MIHTNMPRNCVVFLFSRRLTLSAIYGSQNFDSHKSQQFAKEKENHAILRQICVDHCILLLKHLSNHMYFITNGYKCFLYFPLVRPKATCPYKTPLFINWQNTECNFLFIFQSLIVTAAAKLRILSSCVCVDVYFCMPY